MTYKEAIQYLQPVADNTPLAGYGAALNVALDALRLVDSIVRCKDCKHGELDDPECFPDLYYCHEGCGWNKSDFYCSDGERRNNNNA